MDSCWQSINVSSFIRLQNYVKHFYLYPACKTIIFLFGKTMLFDNMFECRSMKILGGQPAHMGRRVGRTANPNAVAELAHPWSLGKIQRDVLHEHLATKPSD